MTSRTISLCFLLAALPTLAAEPTATPKAFIDGTAPGWRALGEADFVNVNCASNTWTWRDGGVHCTGLVEAVAGFGVSPAPALAVSGNGMDIPDGDNLPALGDHTDFSGVNLTGGTQVRTFTIANSGLMELTLGSITVSGMHAGDLTVTAPPALSVAALGSTTFQVTFDPSMVGLREALLSFSNNDAGENPYSFAIRGTGLNAPPVLGADFVDLLEGAPDAQASSLSAPGFQPVAPPVWRGAGSPRTDRPRTGRNGGRGVPCAWASAATGTAHRLHGA